MRAHISWVNEVAVILMFFLKKLLDADITAGDEASSSLAALPGRHTSWAVPWWHCGRGKPWPTWLWVRLPVWGANNDEAKQDYRLFAMMIPWRKCPQLGTCLQGQADHGQVRWLLWKYIHEYCSATFNPTQMFIFHTLYMYKDICNVFHLQLRYR